METSLLTLSFLVQPQTHDTASSVSNFFLSVYGSPLGDIIFPYPIGVCVNYRVVFTASLWGTFTCNLAGDTVTFTPYGEDYTCQAQTGTIVDYTPSAADYELYSFECGGYDNYVVGDSCTVDPKTPQPEVGDDGEAACCSSEDALCIPQAQATNVCYNLGDGSLYSMISCDNVTASTGVYDAAGCAEASFVEASTASDIDECAFYMNAVIYDVYRKMGKCYEAGENIAALDDYCPYVSRDPTLSPTKSPTTTAPTAPTANPTTDNPTTTEVVETTTEAGVNAYFVKNVIVLAIAIAVYMS